MNPKSGVDNSDFLTPSEVPDQAELRLDRQGLVVSGLVQDVRDSISGSNDARVNHRSRSKRVEGSGEGGFPIDI